MSDLVKVLRNGEVVKVFLNRPQTFNAFDLDMVRQFSECLITLSVDDAVRAVVISGEGKAFCAGGDLKWASNFPRGPSAGFHELAVRFHLGPLLCWWLW